MSAKRKAADFLCAFIAFAIVLLSIAALTGESFFEGAVIWDREEAVLSLFGTDFCFDKNFSHVMHNLISFNDVIFTKGFSKGIERTIGFFAEYVSNGMSFAYRVARMAVGAE